MVDLAKQGSIHPAHHAAPAPRVKRLDWRKRMSDNIAWALLAYTGLQIFVTMHAIEGSSGSALPLLALVVLVAAIIPLCRRFEKRWERLTDDEAADPALASRFRRDRLALWLLAIGLPLVLTALFKAVGKVI